MSLLINWQGPEGGPSKYCEWREGDSFPPIASASKLSILSADGVELAILMSMISAHSFRPPNITQRDSGSFSSEAGSSTVVYRFEALLKPAAQVIRKENGSVELIAAGAHEPYFTMGQEVAEAFWEWMKTQ